MKIMPLNDRVLILPCIKKDVSNFGFLISAISEDRAQSGTIFALAETLANDGCKLEIGDKVLFNKYAGCEVEVDEVKYIIIKLNDIIGKIEEEHDV